jgi:phosphate transport system permease protein
MRTMSHAVGPGPAEEVPRTIRTPLDGADRAYRGLLYVGGLLVLVITGLIGFFLILRGGSALGRAGWRFFTNMQWIPSSNHFGIGAALPNGLIISLIALVIAVPVALAVALFISEYAPARLRGSLIALIDLMAAIPSIIYGLWGVFFLMPRFIGTERWMSDHLGFIPFFRVAGPFNPNNFTSTTFLAGVVVSLMIIPIVASISREVFSQAPQGEREGAYALGSTRWGMIRTVVLPYGRGGMIGAIMLGFGRAMGETIVISLIISPVFSIVTHILQTGGLSIAALIALRYGESTSGMLSSLMAAGLVLFTVTLVVNALAGVIVARSRSGLQTAD